MLRIVPHPVTAAAPAKVNLYLGVGGLRSDGYHELVSIFQALSLIDIVRIEQAETMRLHVVGEGAAEVPRDAGNLAWKAVEFVAAAAGIEPAVQISITKGIPVAGGMAGGSADAAAALVAADAYFRAGLSRAELYDIAARLGSDVPFSLHGGTALGTGRGERLLPVLVRTELHWVLALARTGLSTPAVFGELDRLRAAGDPPTLSGEAALIQALAAGDARQIAAHVGNDMEPAALSLLPDLRRTLRAGRELGALAALVSGSGPTCAFLCESGPAAIELATELSGRGVCRAVRTASGPVPGAQLIDED